MRETPLGAAPLSARQAAACELRPNYEPQPLLGTLETFFAAPWIR